MKYSEIARWLKRSDLCKHISIELIPQPRTGLGPKTIVRSGDLAIELSNMHELLELKTLVIEASKLGRRMTPYKWRHRRERQLRRLGEIGEIEIERLEEVSKGRYERHEVREDDPEKEDF